MPARKRQQAFTLVEIAVIVLTLGILGVVLASQLRGTTGSTAKALTLYKATHAMATSWDRMTTACGTDSRVASAQLIATSPMTAADVLLLGEQAVQPRFLACYQASGTVALNELIH